MPQIVVTIDGKTYRMACADGEEDHLQGLAGAVNARIGELRESFGEIGDLRLTVMAAIMATDELSEARRRIADLEGVIAERDAHGEAARSSIASGREVLVETMNGMSDAIERIASRLEKGR